jgi:hypothetical protein
MVKKQEGISLKLRDGKIWYLIQREQNRLWAAEMKLFKTNGTVLFLQHRRK